MYKVLHQKKCFQRGLKKQKKQSVKVWKEKKKKKITQSSKSVNLNPFYFSWATLIQMNQAELHPPTVPGEPPISTCSVTITAALLNTNCFMWIPPAEGYINIELDKVLFFSFYVLFFTPLFSRSPATSPGWVGSEQTQALTSKSCGSLMIALQKGFLLT